MTPNRVRPGQAVPSRLRRRVQVGYAMADVGLNGIELAIRLYLLIFYTDHVGLSASWAGVALAIGLLWDAVTDPVMGAVSDRYAATLGRRVFVWTGGLLSAASFVLLFAPGLAGPVLALDTQFAKFAWLTFSFCLLNTGMTIVNIPHVAMATEMTELPHERSVLFGWRFACMNVGAIVSAGAPQLFLRGGDHRTVEVMTPFSLVLAGVMVLSSLTTFAATRNVRFRVEPPSDHSFLRQLAEAFGNRAFLPLLLASVLATVGIGANSAAALYYYRYRLLLPDSEAHELIAIALVVFTLSILMWVSLGRRFGKSRPVAWGSLLLGLGTTFVYPFLPAEDFASVMLASSVGLGSLLGCIVLIDSLVTDVIDFDTVRSRARRPGVYFGVWRFAAKLARGAAIAIAGALLDVVGFVPNQQQGESVRTAIALLFGPGVGVWFVAAAVVMWRYRFGDRKQQQVARILARREAARKPIT